MLEAKNQLSRLVKQALDGEDVIIASNGECVVAASVAPMPARASTPLGIERA